jgi:hypothetical protein
MVPFIITAVYFAFRRISAPYPDHEDPMAGLDVRVVDRDIIIISCFTSFEKGLSKKS